MVRLLAESYNTKSNVKLGRFRSQLHASYVSSPTEELLYNEVYLWMTICDERKACKESSDETEIIALIFSAEINLL